MLHSALPALGQVLLLAVLVTLLLGRWIKEARIRQSVVAALLLLCLFVPVYGLSVAQWLRSVVGDLSVLTSIIFLNILAQRLLNFSLLKPASRSNLLWGVVLVGVVFYPLALGVSAYDPYQLGYSPILLTVLLILFSLMAWFRGKRDLAIILLLPLLTYNLHLLESTNLWEYLLDPVLVIYALVQSVAGFKFIRYKKDRGAA
jgi:hypothetical protein